MGEAVSGGTMSRPGAPWHADLTPMHWRILTASFMGWIFDGFESFALFTSSVRATAASFVFNAKRLVAWLFPILAGTMIQFFGGIQQTALVLGVVYVIGLVVPWFLPETKGAPLPE